MAVNHSWNLSPSPSNNGRSSTITQSETAGGATGGATGRAMGGGERMKRRPLLLAHAGVLRLSKTFKASWIWDCWAVNWTIISMNWPLFDDFPPAGPLKEVDDRLSSVWVVWRLHLEPQLQSPSHFRPLSAQEQFLQVPLLLHRHDIFTSHTFQSITGKKSLASQSDPTSEHHCYGLKTVQARIQDTEQTTKAKHKSNSITVHWQIDLCLAVFCLNCWDDHEDQPKRPDLPAIEGYSVYEVVGFSLSKLVYFRSQWLETFEYVTTTQPADRRVVENIPVLSIK